MSRYYRTPQYTGLEGDVPELRSKKMYRYSVHRYTGLQDMYRYSDTPVYREIYRYFVHGYTCLQDMYRYSDTPVYREIL